MRLILWLAAFISLTGVAPRAYCQELKYLALVIGNSSYVGGRLMGPENDAVDIATVLKDGGFLISNQNVQNLDKQSMSKVISKFVGEVDQNTIAIVYYSGHGVEIGNNNYLAPIDASGASISELISLDDVLTRLDQRDARTKVIILDACRTTPPDLRYADIKKSFGDTSGVGLARLTKNLGSGTRIIYAAEPGTVAIGAGKRRNSVFTAALLNSATKANTFDEILILAANETQSVTGNQQRPWLAGNISINFSLNSGAGNTIANLQKAMTTSVGACKPSVKTIESSILSSNSIELGLGKSLGLPANCRIQSISIGDAAFGTSTVSFSGNLRYEARSAGVEELPIAYELVSPGHEPSKYTGLWKIVIRPFVRPPIGSVK